MDVGHGGVDCVDFINNRFIRSLVSFNRVAFPLRFTRKRFLLILSPQSSTLTRNWIIHSLRSRSKTDFSAAARR